MPSFDLISRNHSLYWDTQLQKAVELYNKYYTNNNIYPSQIARITRALQLNDPALITVLLYKARKQGLTLKICEFHFDKNIIHLLEATNTLSLPDYSLHPSHNSIFNKLLYSVNQDIRTKVVLIKLAILLYRVSVFNINSNDSNYQKTAQEIIIRYIPYLSRVGQNHIAAILQDLCFKILYPEERENILIYLHILYPNIENILQTMVTQLSQVLHNSNIKADLAYRIKPPDSIWVKTIVKDINITELHDILALRVIVANKQECYQVIDIIHKCYKNIPLHFTDYIKSPKDNGYRSLHTVVIGPNNRNIEIQVRSIKMHQESQKGTAAHWKYKYRILYTQPTRHISYIIFYNIALTQQGTRLVYSIIGSIIVINPVTKHNTYLYNLPLSFLFIGARILAPAFYDIITPTDKEYNETSKQFVELPVNNESLIKDHLVTDLLLFCMQVNSYSILNIIDNKVTYNEKFQYFVSFIKEASTIPVVLTITKYNAPTILIAKNTLLLNIDPITADPITQLIISPHAKTYKCPSPCVLTSLAPTPKASYIQSGNAKTILHYAVLAGNHSAVQWLVMQGADIYARDDNNNTVLHCATEAEDVETIKWLISKNQDVFDKKQHKTILHLALAHNDFALVEWLIKQGADIHAKDENNASVLHYAAESGNLYIVEWLIRQGADIHAKDDSNNSVLHYAIMYGHLEIAQWLIKNGANIYENDNKNHTVLHLAVLSGELEMVQWVAKNIADIPPQDNNRTVLQYAALLGNFTIIKW